MNDAQPAASPTPSGRVAQWKTWLACLVLVAGTLWLYWPVQDFEFVNVDDQVYVTKNPQVLAGLSWEGLKWAWRANVSANWHPLTLVSHMLDSQLYGPSPRGPHVTNAVLHTLDTLLVFALILMTTRRRWPAFFIAALFAWHPLHVESVAWISERKDVLSAFFGLLTLLAYATYAERSKAQSPKSKVWYALTLLLFALGLMAKPMLVTLPCVMLLLDYWPLARGAWCVVSVKETETSPLPGAGAAARTLPLLILEKIPFFLLAAISCGLTLWAQNVGGAIVATKSLPLGERISNAVLAYFWYVGKNVWPTHLAVFYPYGEPQLNWLFWLAALGLVVLSIIAVCLRKRPYVAVGCFWFLGMLVPVIGLVQVGLQGMADRYAYLPSIGLFIMVVFGLAELASRFRVALIGLTVIGLLALGACLAATRQQVQCWRDSETLFRHAAEVTSHNQIAYNNLGCYLFAKGRLQESVDCFAEATRLTPDYADAHFNLGNSYAALKRRDDAIKEYKTTLQLNPGQARVNYFLGYTLLTEGDFTNAANYFQAELAVNPNHAEAHYQLATLLQQRNEAAAACQHYRDAVRLMPDFTAALNNLSWLLATQPDPRLRNGKEAVQLAVRAAALTHSSNPAVLDTLAGALAEDGQFPEAIKTAETAIRIAQAMHGQLLAQQIQEHLQFYQRGKPVREPAELPPPPGAVTN